MDSDMIQSITSLVAAVIAIGEFIIPIFKKKNKDRKEMYYKKVLLPFVVAYHENNQMDVVSYFTKKHTRDKDYIPPYTFYVCDQPDSDEDEDTPNEKLKKVLLIDYKNYYRDCNNNTMRVLGKLHNIVVTIGCIFLAVVAGLFVYLITLESISMAVNVCLGSSLIEILKIIWSHLATILKYGVCFFAFAFAFSGLQVVENDEYSLKTKDIEKRISDKVSSYNKCHEKYQL